MFFNITKRIVASILTLILIVSASFFMMKVAPGGPFDEEKTPPPHIQKILNEKYHLDKPLAVQYLLYMKDLAKFDLGPSFKLPHLKVNDVIKQSINYTVILGALALSFALICGVFIGVLAALNHNTWLDHILMSSAMLGISIPNMVLAPVLILILGIKLKWIPVFGIESFASYLLPAFCLSLFYLANIARLTRGSFLEIIQSNYVRTAYAKGLPVWKIVTSHCLRPTLIPVISYLGPATASILAGSLVIERVFVIPGIGSQFVDAAFARDYTLALGLILFYCTLVVFFNALVDISYMFLDPRVNSKK